MHGRRRYYLDKKFGLRLPKGNLSLTGFTLIEIIIALTILGIGIVSVMAYLPVALDAAKKAADLTKATLIAQRLIEDLKAASFDDITNADSFDSAGSYLSDSEVAGFEYKIDVDSLGTVSTKDITVSVRWQFKGREIVETFQTKIVKYNPG